ncbi:MAG: 2-oxoacid:ferredoxin oxidoreductase subunit beta [Chloroflexota bacterium]|nr:2-oxoacid:ferredoxin oxidoreductase subunit beta [Dehalococcoidia bacterium]MDW8254944.1 2-oxoacid:ferredoxin oxidoreductase subunit beta [Chloroflexota bacterium]
MVDVAPAPLTMKDYRSEVKPVWCPGCGDFAVLSATYKAMARLGLRREDTVVVSGIGCSSRLPYFVKTYGMHTLHGRALPVATGLKLARPELSVFVFGGDGDLFSIGAGHTPHGAARDIDLTVICMDNSTYGLTKGQTSPTSPLGHKTKSTPYGAVVQPLSPVLLALAFGAGWVGRAYSAKPKQLEDLIVEAYNHKGFSFLHVESPCTEFNNTYNYFDALVEDLPPDYDPTDREAAIRLALTEEKVHLGVFYKDERRVDYHAKIGAWTAERGRPFDAIAYLQQYA